MGRLKILEANRLFQSGSCTADSFEMIPGLFSRFIPKYLQSSLPLKMPDFHEAISSLDFPNHSIFLAREWIKSVENGLGHFQGNHSITFKVGEHALLFN